MAQYIDKDALVADIERLISNGQVKLQESQQCNDYESSVAWSEHIATCGKVLSLLNTIEVKEVDIDKQIEYEYNPIDGLSFEEFERIAKHFFELGLQAQKGEY